MTITVSAEKITRWLAIAVIGLTLASVAGQFSKYYLGHGTLLGLVQEFSTDGENNIPTWYSSVTLLTCSILLAAIAVAKKAERDRYFLHWTVMSLIFLAFSLDESASLHELTIEPLRGAVEISSYFYFSWVVVGIVSGIIFLLVFMRFIMALPAGTKHLFLLSGLLFVFGAIGMELIGGNYSFSHEGETMAYMMITSVEEFLEMSGIVVFIYSLMRYIRFQFRDLHVHFRD